MSSIADRRAEALKALSRAREQGWKFNDWQGLAEELASLLPAPAGCKSLDRSCWADYRAPRYRQKGYEKCEFVFAFADGELVKVSHPSHLAKPYNWGEASRVAIAFWRSRVRARAIGCVPMHVSDPYERRLTPPAIASMECNGVCGERADGVAVVLLK